MTVRERFRRARWYARELAGETAYDRYAAHRRRAHPDEPVMSEREFWRWRMDERTRNPGARCC
jgi:uncharacterized short protein YbdD (DUF466 family)